MARVLVTGATGFIGQHLVRMLLARGDDVTCLRRSSSNVQPLQGLKVRFAEGDITAAESLPAAVRDMEVVYHLAGLLTTLRKEDFFRVNEQGARNLMEANADAGTPPVVVMVSSLAAGGPQVGEEVRKEEDVPAPVSWYGKSKRAAEIVSTEFANRVPLTIVRPPIVFGGGDRATLQMFRPIARFGIHLVPGYRRKNFSLIHVEDLCQGLLLAAEKGQRVRGQASGGRRQESGKVESREPRVESQIEAEKVQSQESRNGGQGNNAFQGYYYFAHDERPTYAELGRMIGEALGRKRTVCVPTAIWFMRLVACINESIGRMRGRPPVLNLDKARDAAAGSWTCSAERAKLELGWSCGADLMARLRQTVQWYREERWL